MWTSDTTRERDGTRRRERKDSISAGREGEAKCSECNLMGMLRRGLGVQILLVTAVQTCYSHTNTNVGETTTTTS